MIQELDLKFVQEDTKVDTSRYRELKKKIFMDQPKEFAYKDLKSESEDLCIQPMDWSNHLGCDDFDCVELLGFKIFEILALYIRRDPLYDYLSWPCMLRTY